MSKDGQRRWTSSSTAGWIAASCKLAASHALCCSLETAAFSGSAVKKRKPPKGSSKVAGRPQHSSCPKMRRSISGSPTQTCFAGPVWIRKSGPYFARRSRSISVKGTFCTRRSQMTEREPNMGTDGGPGGERTMGKDGGPGGERTWLESHAPACCAPAAVLEN